MFQREECRAMAVDAVAAGRRTQRRRDPEQTL